MVLKYVHGSLSSDFSLRTFGMLTGKLVNIKISLSSSNPWFMAWRFFFDESRHLSFRSISFMNLSASSFIESTSLVSAVLNTFAPVCSSWRYQWSVLYCIAYTLKWPVSMEWTYMVFGVLNWWLLSKNSAYLDSLLLPNEHYFGFVRTQKNLVF